MLNTLSPRTRRLLILNSLSPLINNEIRRAFEQEGSEVEFVDKDEIALIWNGGISRVYFTIKEDAHGLILISSTKNLSCSKKDDEMVWRVVSTYPFPHHNILSRTEEISSHHDTPPQARLISEAFLNQMREELAQVLNVEGLEYLDKNLLAGDDESRSRWKQKVLTQLLQKFDQALCK